jgi:hypothetical protein
METLACPSCAQPISVAAELAGRVVRCRGCQARLAIGKDASGMLTLGSAPAPVPAPVTIGTASDASAPCPRCGAALRATDAFCTGCGAPVDEAARRRIAESATRKERSLTRRERYERKEAETRERDLLQAAGVIKWLAILFVFFGFLEGMLQRRAADRELAAIPAEARDEDPLPLSDGTVVSVHEFRAQQELLVTLSFAINFVLAGIMFALHLWALRAPLPANITALCIYLVVLLLAALVDPRDLLRGVLMKVICIGFLLRGIQAALAERAASAAAARRAAREAAGT